jgi:hypothetical protein
LLADGPVPVTTIKERAVAEGIKERTLNRAKKNLGVRSTKAGFADSSWQWELPAGAKIATEGGQPPNELGQVATFDQNEAEPPCFAEGGQEGGLTTAFDGGQRAAPSPEGGRGAEVGHLRENTGETGDPARRRPPGHVHGDVTAFGAGAGSPGAGGYRAPDLSPADEAVLDALAKMDNRSVGPYRERR